MRGIFIALSLIFVTTSSLSIPCQICHHIVAAIQHSAPEKLSLAAMEEIGVLYCLKKNIQDKTVCTGAIHEMGPPIVNSLWRHYSDPHLVCPKLHFCKKEYIKRNLTQEIQKIIENKPNKEWQPPTKNKLFKVLHISDLHPDLFYTPGAQVKCQEPVCCRSNVSASLTVEEAFAKVQKNEINQIKDKNVKQPAGYWGSIGTCDLPLQTFNVFLSEVEKLSIDAIIWTGDNTPHDIWAQTQSYNLNFTILLAEKLSQVTGAVILPAMGNHESWPVNVYDFEGRREDVLNGGLAQAWRKWLSQEAYTQLRTKGYYSMTHKSLNNLKVIGLNTQAGNDMNWFLLRNPTDPGKMLVWLENELKQSEKIGQLVYLIGHIPPTENLNDWSMRYNALVDRYSYIIRGQFFGHTHSDHLSFFPKFKEHQASKNISADPLSNYYLVAPSITTYSDRVPEYRVMDVDFDTLQVVDYRQYRLDLKKFTSKQDSPKFQLLYSFLEAYNLKDMTVAGGMTSMRNQLRDDPEVQKKFSHYKSGGLRDGSSGKNVFCDAMTAPLFNAECLGNSLGKSSFDKYAGPWKQLRHESD